MGDRLGIYNVEERLPGRLTGLRPPLTAIGRLIRVVDRQQGVDTKTPRSREAAGGAAHATPPAPYDRYAWSDRLLQPGQARFRKP